MNSRPLSAPPNRTSRKPTSKSSSTRKLSSKDVNSMKQELKELRKWKTKTDKKINSLLKQLEKTKRDLNQLDDKVQDSTIDMNRMTYVMNVVKYILKQKLSVDFTPYHIDARRPNVVSDGLPSSRSPAIV